MKHLFAAIVLLFALALPASADEPSIKQVISSQIRAFEEDDFDTAFTFASPAIRKIFGTSERFGTMVRQGYPMVWRPVEVRFLSTETLNGMLWQNVLIRDASGALYVLKYNMVKYDNGWKINAVHIEHPPADAV